MKKKLSLAYTAIVISLFSLFNIGFTKVVTPPAITFNDQSSFDIDGDLWNDCTGEWVHISGEIHFTVHGMINGNRISLVQHGNCQGLSGVGLSSHKHYAGSNVFNDVYNGNFTGLYTAISSSSVRLNASGSDNNLTVVVRTKTTVNGNGEVSASHLEDAMSCQ
jgi:hypothetical protein